MNAFIVVAADDDLTVMVSSNPSLPSVLVVSALYHDIEIPPFPLPMSEIEQLLGGKFVYKKDNKKADE